MTGLTRGASLAVSEDRTTMVPDLHLLSALVNEYATGRSLTPGERKELIHIAQGFAAKDSAVSESWAVQAIRTRRKRLFRKLGVSGSHEAISALLALALKMLASGERLYKPMSPDFTTLQVPTNHAAALYHRLDAEQRRHTAAT